MTQLTASIKRSFEDVLVRGDEQLILQVGTSRHGLQLHCIYIYGCVHFECYIYLPSGMTVGTGFC